MKRRRWTIAEWADFAQRARDVRDRLDDLIRTFPETPGLTTKHINAFVKAHTRLVHAMIRTESVFADQYPDCDRDNGSIRFIHGDKLTNTWRPCKGRVPKDAPILSRAEWVAMGNRVKAIRLDIQALGMAFQWTTNKVNAQRFFKAADTVGTAKFLLDSLVVRQHPDWSAATRVFYGDPLVPEETPA